MANVNRPAGLVPVGNLNGAAWNGQANLYSIPASYGTLMQIGDPVTLDGSGTTITGIPGIRHVAAGDATSGVAYYPIGAVIALGKYQNLMANPSNLDVTSRPASDPLVWYALVVDDPNTIFEVQDIGSSTALTYGDLGSCINLNAGTAGTYLSGWGIDNNSKAATLTYQMKILRLSPKANNAVGQYSRWLCKINMHGLANNMAGI
jgi:hypothetical protein